MFSRRLISTAGLAILAVSLTGCGTPSRQTVGTAGGAVLGGAAGNAVTGSTAGTIGGAAIGGVIGNQVTKP